MLDLGLSQTLNYTAVDANRLAALSAKTLIQS